MERAKLKCRLCGKLFYDEEMSEEHYPARSVGNEDVVALNIVKMFDSLVSEKKREKILNRLSNGESFERIAGDIFDNELAESIYPQGRTARTLCRMCNTFLGKYDEAYLKIFSLDGEAEALKGFSKKTKEGLYIS